MKSITFIGRITKDAKLEDRNGLKVTNFNVAVNTRKATAEKDENGKRKYKTDTEYYRVSLWRELAESLTPYLGKGRLVAVTSNDYTLETWMDKQNVVRPVIHLTNPKIELCDANKQAAEEPAETMEAAPVAPEELPFD